VESFHLILAEQIQRARCSRAISVDVPYLQVQALRVSSPQAAQNSTDNDNRNGYLDNEAKVYFTLQGFAFSGPHIVGMPAKH
jgi:hypothetical protein